MSGASTRLHWISILWSVSRYISDRPFALVFTVWAWVGNSIRIRGYQDWAPIPLEKTSFELVLIFRDSLGSRFREGVCWMRASVLVSTVSFTVISYAVFWNPCSYAACFVSLPDMRISFVIYIVVYLSEFTDSMEAVVVIETWTLASLSRHWHCGSLQLNHPVQFKNVGSMMWRTTLQPVNINCDSEWPRCWQSSLWFTRVVWVLLIPVMKWFSDRPTFRGLLYDTPLTTTGS